MFEQFENTQIRKNDLGLALAFSAALLPGCGQVLAKNELIISPQSSHLVSEGRQLICAVPNFSNIILKDTDGTVRKIVDTTNIVKRIVIIRRGELKNKSHQDEIVCRSTRSNVGVTSLPIKTAVKELEDQMGIPRQSLVKVFPEN